MSRSQPEPVTIRVDDAHTVSGLLLAPPQARACYLLAHGAGAGMTHPFLQVVATNSPSGTSPRCAISSRTWSEAADGRTLPGSRKRRCAPPQR